MKYEKSFLKADPGTLKCCCFNESWDEIKLRHIVQIYVATVTSADLVLLAPSQGDFQALTQTPNSRYCIQEPKKVHKGCYKNGPWLPTCVCTRVQIENLRLT